jgi:dolichol-phosphate mannosyltransferase
MSLAFETRPALSVVIPVFNEEGNLKELHRRLSVAVSALAPSYEILFVNDGSRDGSRAMLDELFRADPHVRVIHFSRNFGHHVALTAGLDHAKGERVVMMDADLQDQPEEIPKLWRKIDEGYDIAYAIRMHRKDGIFKRATSAMFIAAMNRLTNSQVSLTSGVFRMATRRVVENVRRLREQHRFVIGLMTWLGFREVGVEVEHAARFHGETKYSLLRMIKLALNTITAFSQVPLKIASVLGLLISGLSFLAALVIAGRKIFYDIAVLGWASTFVLIAFLGGVQLLVLGIIGEYIGRMYLESLGRPLYVVDVELEHPPQLTASAPAPEKARAEHTES